MDRLPPLLVDGGSPLPREVAERYQGLEEMIVRTAAP